MSIRQIRDVDIITHTRSVRCWIIRAENLYFLTFAHYGFAGNFDEMCGT